MLIQFIQNNEYIRELDISWSEVRQSTYARLLESLADNSKLTHLTFTWNIILEENEQNKLLE
jgi:hypothetical protein